MALKCLDHSSSDSKNKLQKEINLMEKVDHDHVVRLFGHFLYENSSSKICCLVTEFCEVSLVLKLHSLQK